MKSLFSRIFFVPVLLCSIACSQVAYDTSRGIDPEMTLFTDEVSFPLGDIGPLSPKQLLGEDVDLGEMLGGIFKEDEEGYLVVENEESFFSTPILLLSTAVADPTQPLDVPIDDYMGFPGAPAQGPVFLGLLPALQEFSLYASNPLTDGMAVSGKLTLSALADEEKPDETLSSAVFDKEPVAAESKDAILFRTTYEGARIMDVCTLENMTLHLPASFLEKDPLGGWNSISMGYRYKAYLSLGQDFPVQIPIPIDDLDLPIAQYQVKDVLLSMEVSNEIPLTLLVESVEVLVTETDEDGYMDSVVCENVSITPGLTIASGQAGAPVVSPLVISIKALEGTLPDMAGLQLILSVKTPTGEGDKRLNMNQSITFNNLRATVSGGITIQGL